MNIWEDNIKMELQEIGWEEGVDSLICGKSANEYMGE
jgi:hypothetical protein